MRTRVSMVIASVVVACSGCAPQGSTSAVDLAAEEVAVRAVSDSWLAFNGEQDAAGVAGLFAPDGTIIWEGRKTASGPEAVEAFMTETYAFDAGEGGSFGPERVDVAASGDLAVEQGAWEGSGEVGQYITIYRKDGGDWKVAADMSMSTTANGGAPAWASDLLAEWYEAFNARDAARLADIYSADARIRDARGRQAIISHFEAEWAETKEDCSGGFDGFEVVGPVAVGWGRDTCTEATAGGETTTPSRSTWLAVYEQQEDGSWLCIRDIGEAVEQ